MSFRARTCELRARRKFDYVNYTCTTSTSIILFTFASFGGPEARIRNLHNTQQQQQQTGVISATCTRCLVITLLISVYHRLSQSTPSSDLHLFTCNMCESTCLVLVIRLPISIGCIATHVALISRPSRCLRELVLTLILHDKLDIEHR